MDQPFDDALMVSVVDEVGGIQFSGDIHIVQKVAEFFKFLDILGIEVIFPRIQLLEVLVE